MPTFKESSRLEREFVSSFKNYLAVNNISAEFIPYQLNKVNNPLYHLQKKEDVDVIMLLNGIRRNVSLKAVKQPYKNIFYEILSNTILGALGWAYYCKAEFMIYAMKKRDHSGWICHYFDPRHVKRLADENCDEYPLGRGETNFDNGDKYVSIGFLVPLSQIKHFTIEI